VPKGASRVQIPPSPLSTAGPTKRTLPRARRRAQRFGVAARAQADLNNARCFASKAGRARSFLALKVNARR
jgi:hypothetical protein